MYKFFVNNEQISGKYIEIRGSDVNHIVNVLRLGVGSKVIVCDKQNSISYMVEIEKLEKEKVLGLIIEKIEDTTETYINIDLFQGLPKADKMEYIIQKGTELGVKNIFPVILERCIVKIDEKSIVKKIENICKNIDKYDIIILAYENENKTSLKEELKKLNKNKKLNIGIIIGPEGGFSEREIQRLVECGTKCVSLGKRILRTETASIVAISNIIYEFEL